MIIVSDTTPIISFIKINKLDLLHQLFDEVLIPDAVFRELTANKLFTDEAEIVRNTKFLKTISVKNRQSLEILQAVSGLDDGESEAIVLANEQKSDALIIDERKGRKVAQKLGITVTGSIGILIQANNEKLISKDDVKSCIDILKNCNIRLSDNLIQEALDMLE